MAATSEDTRRDATRKLDDYSLEDLAAAWSIIRERLGIAAGPDDPDPLVDLKDIAELAGLAPDTPGQQRQRSKAGDGRVKFPAEDPKVGLRWEEKPLFRAVTGVIPYLEATGNWPPGAGARPTTRGPRQEWQRGAHRTGEPMEQETRYTVKELEGVDLQLALKLRSAGRATSGRRSVDRWRAILETA